MTTLYLIAPSQEQAAQAHRDLTHDLRGALFPKATIRDGYRHIDIGDLRIQVVSSQDHLPPHGDVLIAELKGGPSNHGTR